MAWDRPLFGAGPGNFQSVYERFREPTTAEQIADPHNFLFETLGSGGWIGLILLACILYLAMRVHLGTTRVASEVPSVGGTENRSDHGRAIWIGAIVSLAMVWLFGFATLQLPDVGANLFALPVVGFVAVVLMPTISNLPSDAADRGYRVTLAMVVLHLTVAGGWTVPGVAFVVWICAGVLTRIQRAGESANESGQFFHRSVYRVGLCVGLMLVLYFISLRPVETVRQQMAIADHALATGQYGLATRSLETASASDPWSPVPEIRLADLKRWEVVRGEGTESQQAWRESLDEARRRGGEDPALLRAIGTQQLHLYQRYGEPEDLQAAAETFQTAVQWSPVDQWMIAQLASIEATRGNDQRSRELADLSRQLSGLGVNVERGFNFQLIYPAAHFGDQAKQGPIRRPAQEVLFEPR